MSEFFQITCSPSSGLHTFTRIDECTQLAKLEEIRGNVESRDNWDNSYIVSADNWDKIVCLKCREEIHHPRDSMSWLSKEAHEEVVREENYAHECERRDETERQKLMELGYL